MTRIEELSSTPIHLSNLEFPVIIKTAEKHRLLNTINNNLERVYLNSKVILDRVLIESLLAVALFNCENRHGYIVHTTALLKLGVSLSEIKALTTIFSLPKSSFHWPRWNNLVKFTFDSFRGNRIPDQNMKFAKKLLSLDEYEDYTHIIFLAKSYRHLLICFEDEIGGIKEYQLLIQNDQIREEIKDLIKYFETKHMHRISIDG